MSRILVAWELGAGYGHLQTFPDLAHTLRNRGHDVVFVVRDLTSAESVLGRHGFDCLQAPVWPMQKRHQPTPCFAEILARLGYRDPGDLIGLVKAWRKLYDLLAPDVLLVNHSPTALLAAEGLDVPRLMIGTGFECPPRTEPIPSLMPWQNVPTVKLAEIETRVSNVMNEVRTRMGLETKSCFSALFDVEGTMLCTLQELDAYAEHRGEEAHYWGPRLYSADGTPPKWPSKKGRRIFGYLKTEYPGFKALVEALGTVKESVLLHVPGIPYEVARKYQRANLAFSTRPVDLQQVAAQCDLVLSHAGHGTTATFLLSGRAQLLLPSQVEQGVTAWRMMRSGLALAVLPGRQRVPLPRLIEQMLEDSTFAERAEMYARTQMGFDPATQVEALADNIESFV